MKVLITGGAGFIGSNLAHALCDHPRIAEVRVLDDLSTGDKTNLADLDIDFVEGSILDAQLLEEACSNVDAIVHLAARPSVPRSLRDPIATHHANATGTLLVLEAARHAGGPYVVAASSSSVYGSTPTLPKHEGLPVAPMSPYAVSKLATESYLSAYHHSFELPVLPFRFFNVYGPGQSADHGYAAVIPKWIRAALAGHPAAVHGDGRQTRDFTYVGTVCRILTDALLRKVTSPTPVNLAYGTRTSLLELAVKLEAATGTMLPLRHVSPRPGDVPHSQADSDRLHELFPDVTPVPLGLGLCETTEWHRRH